MKRATRLLPLLLLLAYQPRQAILPASGAIEVHRTAAHDVSPPLHSLRPAWKAREPLDCGHDCGDSPGDPDDDRDQAPGASTREPPVSAAAAAIEQKAQGARAAAKPVVSFDGLGVGFEGPQGPAAGRNPSDNSLAAGPDRIFQIVNSSLAILSKAGKVLYGAVPTNTIFRGFGGPCEERDNGDAVVRYDQLADRWLIVMPIFNRIVGRPDEQYAMCYAVSQGPDPMGQYYRYEFRRKLFPDYPRPAIWPDGYYIPSSSGDNVVQKHACVADRANMLKGREATEQCVVIEGVNFLNSADLDGQNLPPTGAPNILMATGGSQLRRILQDDAIYAWQFRVSWSDPSKTRLGDPVRIPVAQYHYLCGGQLTNCVPQPGTATRLDAQATRSCSGWSTAISGIVNRLSRSTRWTPLRAEGACAGTNSASMPNAIRCCTSRAPTRPTGSIDGWPARRWTGRAISPSDTRSAARPTLPGNVSPLAWRATRWDN
jgi:hypothetical protein